MATKRTTKPPRAPRKPKDVELDGTESGYCVKCKKKNAKMVDIVLTFVKPRDKWRPMLKGQHDKCGTTMTKFVNQEYVDDLGL